MDTVTVTANATPNVEALFRSDSDRLWRAIYAFAGDANLASDAVAESYAQLIRRGQVVRDPAAWTWRAAFLIARGALKRTRDASVDAVAPPVHEDRYADPDLLAALRDLPDGQRAAIVLFYYADLPVRDIAARLGSNPLVVRTNLSRGRRRLRALLGDRHG
jgi:RNA polymerase sigma-70 factor (ECF subfamily)